MKLTPAQNRVLRKLASNPYNTSIEFCFVTRKATICYEKGLKYGDYISTSVYYSLVALQLVDQIPIKDYWYSFITPTGLAALNTETK